MTAIPFLRWAGGKRWLASSLAPLLAEVGRGRYFEPFLGSGSVFFALAPSRAHLSDINEDLINAYHWVRRDPLGVQRIVSGWSVDRDTYALVRGKSELEGVRAAARFIYLNRTCYGGIYRTNQSGQFNTPYGGGSRTPEVLWKHGVLARCSEVLDADVSLRCSDFERMIDRAVDGDVVFCDPTYGDATGRQFDRYGARKFGWEDQIRLASAINRAANRGVVAVICNSCTTEIEDLYPRGYRFRKNRKKSIGNARVHGSDDELVIVVDPYERNAVWMELGPIESGSRAVSSIA